MLIAVQPQRSGLGLERHLRPIPYGAPTWTAPIELLQHPLHDLANRLSDLKISGALRF